MQKLLCRPGILFFYHFYRTILSEIERENERNILDYWAIFCPYYVIFFFSPFFSRFFLSFLFLLPHYFLSVLHYFLVFTALFTWDPGSRGSQTFSMYDAGTVPLFNLHGNILRVMYFPNQQELAAHFCAF